MQKIGIDVATNEQLRKFASAWLGIDISATAKRETILAKIGPAWDQPEILIDDEPAEQIIPADSPFAGRDAPKPGYVRVLIAIQEEAGGSDPVPLGCNGSIMLVERAKPQDIPERYFESLKNAATLRYEDVTMRDEEGNTHIQRRVHEVPLYPYSVLARTAAPKPKESKEQKAA